MHNKNTCCFCFVEKRKEINGQLDNLIDNIKEGENEKMKPRTVEKSIEIPEGRHKGIIMKIEERQTEHYGIYIDFHITVDKIKNDKDQPILIKVGFNDNLTQNSGLYRFLSLFGVMKLGESIDYEKQALNKEISYMTENKVTEKGIFANISRTSIQLP